jgi:isoleucyl-tRNA synthetase
MCYAALNIRNFNKSYISNIAEKASKKGRLEDFMNKYLALTSNYINNEYIKTHL